MNAASLQEPLTLRRVLFSLLVAGIVAVLTGGALGFAAAQDTPSAPLASGSSEPRLFGVPEPRLHDVFVHSSSSESTETGPEGHGHAASAPETLVERYTWSRVQPFLNHEGEGRAALVLLHEYEFVIEGEPQHGATEGMFDAATRQSLASIYEGESANTFQEDTSYLPGFSTTGSSVWTFRGVSWHTDSFGQRSCFLFNELQGRTVDLGQDVVLFRDCYLPGDAEPQAGTRLFRAIGEGTVGERAAVIFAELTDGTPTEDARKVWMSEDVPYPVHFTAEIDQDFWPQGSYTITLTEYVPGGEPLPYEGEPGHGLPPLDLRPRTPWTLDDAGITHEFPLSEAYASARDDLQFEDVRAFLEEHPAAQVVRADFQEQHTNNGDRALVWNWVLFDDGEALYVCSAEMVRTTPDVVPWSLPAEQPAATLVSHADCDPEQEEMLEAVTPPAQLPSVASLFERWRRASGPDYADVAPNMYGFAVECVHHDAPGPACVPTLALGVGYVRFEVEQGTLGVYVPVADDQVTFDWAMSRLTVEPDGELSFLHELVLASEFDFTSGGPAGNLPSSKESQSPIVAQSQRTTTSIWELPAGRYAAGTGFLALLAGFAYWIWPVLKGAVAIPFFSRVEKPRALEHAARAEIHALVQANPGVHAEEIVRRTGRGRGDIQHHLRKLVGVGLLAEVRAAGFTCYHVPGQVDQRVAAALPALKSDGARAVLAAIAAQPGSSGTRLATTTGLTRQAVHLHVQRLAEAGLVTTERAGREVRVQATALAAQVPAAA